MTVVESPHSVAETVVDPHETVSVEDTSGRVLSGSGITEDALTEGLRDAETRFPDQPENPERPPKGRQRYAELTKQRDEAKAAASAEKQRNEDLASRLALLEAATTKALQPQRELEPVVEEGRKKPTSAEIGTKYVDYDAFTEDLADWKAEQREIKLREEFNARFEARIEAERASRAQSSQADTVLTRGRASYPDFDAVVNACPVVFPEAMLRAIVALPQAEHIEYALASNPELAERIAKIPDGLTLGLELAKLQPSGGRVTPASRPSGVRSSQAPPPFEPVGTGTSTTSPPLADLAASGNYLAFKAARDAQRAANGGRR
jgi:hypothetical protein